METGLKLIRKYKKKIVSFLTSPNNILHGVNSYIFSLRTICQWFTFCIVRIIYWNKAAFCTQKLYLAFSRSLMLELLVRTKNVVWLHIERLNYVKMNNIINNNNSNNSNNCYCCVALLLKDTNIKCILYLIESCHFYCIYILWCV